MKTIFAILALCAFTQSALAANRECRALESANARLACYDAASPPKIEKPLLVEKDATRPPYKDPFSEDDARIAAKLKNICRGC